MFEHVNKCGFCIEKDDTAKHFKKKFVKVDHKRNKAGPYHTMRIVQKICREQKSETLKAL